MDPGPERGEGGEGGARGEGGEGGARCERCLLQRRVCLCADIPMLPSRTRIVIVRHHLERWRSSNSGRLAHLALPNSEIVDHGGGAPTRLPDLTGAWLLYPEGPEIDLAAAPPPPPRRLVVLDATWSQARRMYRKLHALRGLPTLRLPDGPMAAARLRESPGPGRVSTIEAIARALRLLEGPAGEAAEAGLLGLFELAVARAAASGRNVLAGGR
jgi:DTW domain-containing protein YfiP